MPDYSAGRECNDCGVLKPIEAYYLSRGKWIQQPCKDCYARRREDPAYRAEAIDRSRQYRRRLRDEALEAYGHHCACCGEEHYEFLALDHVNGGGTKHRAERGQQVYLDAKREGYPDTYRILCHNCNQATGIYGYCPHQHE